MFRTIKFRRFDKSSHGEDSFIYEKTDGTKAYEDNPTVVSLENPGFNQHVSIANHMAESVCLKATVLEPITLIKPITTTLVRTRSDRRNLVHIRIYSSQVEVNFQSTKKTTKVEQTDIVVPGKLLNQGSVFIDELGSYLTTESNLEATKELIANDLDVAGNQTAIDLSSDLISPDPALLYHEYQPLVEISIRRQDRVRIRVGRDLATLSDHDPIKTLRVGIMDHYFIPFRDNRMSFDPTLEPDEFVLENIYLTSSKEYRSNFRQLEISGMVVLDPKEHDTLFGKFYGMAIFSTAERYAEYVYQRKTLERFEEEQLFLMERTGDALLREMNVKLNSDNVLLKANLKESEGRVTSLNEQVKNLVATVRNREQTLKDIRDRKDELMSTPVIELSLQNDAAKITQETREQQHKAAMAPLVHKAALWKSIADLLKTGWGIVGGVVTGLLMFIGILKKYNVRLVMG